MAKKLAEETKLVRFLVSKAGESIGRQGVLDNLSPAESAIRAIKSLQRELKEAKADAAEMLNNQRETIAALQARAMPEDWDANGASSMSVTGNLIRVVRERPDGSFSWIVSRLSRGSHPTTTPVATGVADTFNEAIKEASKAGKKTRR